MVKQASNRISRARNQSYSGMQLNHFLEVIMTPAPALNDSETYFQFYSPCPSTYQHFCLKWFTKSRQTGFHQDRMMFMKTNHFLKQRDCASKHSSSVTLSTFFSGLYYCHERQAGYMQYPDLNSFYLCDAATELTNWQMTSVPGIPTSMVNSTPTLSMI